MSSLLYALEDSSDDEAVSKDCINDSEGNELGKRMITSTPKRKQGSKRDGDQLLRTNKVVVIENLLINVAPQAVNTEDNTSDGEINSIINKAIQSTSKSLAPGIQSPENDKQFDSAIRNLLNFTLDQDETVINNSSKDVQKENEPVPSTSKKQTENTILQLNKRKKLSKNFISCNANFNIVYNHTKSNIHLQNLFIETEKSQLTRFVELPPEYKYFCCQLFLNGDNWVNVFSFANKIQLDFSGPEITRLYKTLSDSEFLLIDFRSEAIINLLQILRLNDLKAICEELSIPIKKNVPHHEKKSRIIETLISLQNRTINPTKDNSEINSIPEADLRESIYKRTGYIIKLQTNFEKALSKLHILYAFANETLVEPQKLYRFLDKKNAGEVILPMYPCDTINFFDKDGFERYVKAFRWKQYVSNYIKTPNADRYRVCKEICEKAYNQFSLEQLFDDLYEYNYPEHTKQFSAGHVCAVILTLGAKYLKSSYPRLVETWISRLLNQMTYCTHKRGVWYKLLVSVHFRYLKNIDKVACLICDGTADDYLSEVDKYKLSTTGKTVINSPLCKLKKHHDKIAMQCLVVDFDVNTRDFPMEKYYSQMKCADKLLHTADINYRKIGYNFSLYLTDFLVTILTIFMWDIMYNEYVNYAFISKIQFYPLDLMYNFYKLRKKSVDKQLEMIHSKWTNDEFTLYVKRIWKEHSSKRTLINSDCFKDVDHLLQMFSIIGRDTLSEILKRTLENIEQNRIGFPDIFFFNANKQYKFVYVKKRNACLIPEQQLWVHYLKLWNINVEICVIAEARSRSAIKPPHSLKKKTVVETD